MPKVIAFGDNVVDCYDAQGCMFPGGNAPNLAVFARRAGAETSYIGAVSDDAAGRHIRDSLITEGVDVSRMRILPGRTAYCVIGTRDGEREFLRADLGVSIIEPDAQDLAYLGAFDAVHTGRSSHVDAHLESFRQRARLSYDFAVVRDPERIARIAPLCFLASFSGGDLSDDEVAQLCRLACDAGAAWCLVTRGREGAVLASPGGIIRTPAAEVEVVDTLGAGDTFIARSLVGLLNGEDPQALLAAAARAAGETCGRLGGFGPAAPIEIDESHALTLGEIYGTAPAERA